MLHSSNKLLHSIFNAPHLRFIFSSFLVNSQDRVIRVFDRELVLKWGDSIDPEPIQKLQDLVNRFVNICVHNPVLGS